MARSRVHGEVTLEHSGRTGADEPVFVLAAHDKLSARVLDDYYARAIQAGCHPDFLNSIQQVRADFATWQYENHQC
jgi:hypothetical protein